MDILEWLAGHDKGLSSEAIAFTALGRMPNRPNYPHDGDDFGRCVRLLALCPAAKAGLEKLGRDGGPMWRALYVRWDEIETAWWSDLELYESGAGRKAKYKCYDLMRSILKPAEDEDLSVVFRGENFSVHRNA